MAGKHKKDRQPRPVFLATCCEEDLPCFVTYRFGEEPFHESIINFIELRFQHLLYVPPCIESGNHYLLILQINVKKTNCQSKNSGYNKS